MKKAKLEMENPSFTCPNPMCGRAFLVPITAHNLASKQASPYYACPYCLTEVSLEQSSDQMETKDVAERRTLTIEQETAEHLEEEPEKPELKEGSACPYHFGYLSQRSRKEVIPEECMTCERIVQCMLDKIKG